MLFNSFHFILFFCFIVPTTYLLPSRWRWLCLILASCYFYMVAYPVHILILFTQISIDYFAALKIDSASGAKRKTWLVFSLSANLIVLGTFKYANFLTTNLGGLLSWFNVSYPVRELDLVLPLGISFYTFQSMSYAIEVYRRNSKPEHHYGYYAAYVLFWPQLIAGPIERPNHLLPQLRSPPSFQWENIVQGLKFILRGYFKKVVVADRLSSIVGAIYQAPESYSGTALALGTFFFAIQIYCDFSGYSDVAVGSARTMGFHIRENFNYPYFATSFSDFWKKWHISLSTWFRDYIYIPLGGSRCSSLRRFMNLVSTFFISGLWHGASWTFVVWGLTNGILIALESLFFELLWQTSLPLIKHPLLSLIRTIYALLSLVCINLTWVFFRAESLADASLIFGRIFTDVPLEFTSLFQHFLRGSIAATRVSARELELALVCILFLLVSEAWGKIRNVSFLQLGCPLALRLGAYSGLLWFILLLGKFQHAKPFIYFKF